MVYGRPPGTARSDFNAAKEFEAAVREHLDDTVVDESNSAERLDFWQPGFFLEVKEKRQPISTKWASHIDRNWDLKDVFILDELSLRKALDQYPYAYFICRDVPLDRLFLVSVVDLACMGRGRVDRATSSDRRKGKLLYNMNEWTQIESLEGIEKLIRADLQARRWKLSECLSVGEWKVEQL